MRVYSNFDEINQDLRILKLKKEISKEEIRINYSELKNNATSSTSLVRSIKSITGSMLQKVIIKKIVNKFISSKV